MKVILTEKVPHLGNVGELVNVSQGHARNYLIPNRLAVLADESQKKQLEDNQRRLAKKIEGEKKTATDLAKKMKGITIELTKKVGGNGKLFGSITSMELAKLLAEKGVEVERRVLAMEQPIKQLGTFEVKAKLFNDVEGVFQVKVLMDPKQAEEIKAREKAAEKKKSAKKEKGDKEEATQEVEAKAPEEKKTKDSDEKKTTSTKKVAKKK